MAATIPEKYLDLLDSKKAFAHLATLMPDGWPQVTPVWCDREGSYVRINSARGRIKDLNMRREPRITLCLSDPDNAYRYLEIRGRVMEITENGADDHINLLAKKYLGADVYPNRRPGEVRVIYRVKVERAFGRG